MKNKIVLSESEKSEIKKMYRILLEQGGTSIVPKLAIDAISKIESIYGHMDNGKVVGYPYTGKEKLSVMENYIKNTIGLDCWNNMSDKMKAQIYSFCFQADTDVPYKMKFIAGLANAIDSSIERGKIVGKPLTDSNVKNAINVIKNNCKNISDYYGKYLGVVDAQYKSMDYNGNYEAVWKYRPTAIDRIMKGEKIDTVLGEWNNTTVEDKPTNTSSNKNQVKNDDTTTKDSNLPRRTTGSVVLEKDAFNKLSKKIQDYSNRVFEEGEALSVGEFNLSYKNNENKIFVEISTNPSGEKYSKLVLAINDEAKRAQESKGYNLIKSGKIQLPGEFASSNPDGYGWYLFGEPIK